MSIERNKDLDPEWSVYILIPPQLSSFPGEDISPSHKVAGERTIPIRQKRKRGWMIDPCESALLSFGRRTNGDRYNKRKRLNDSTSLLRMCGWTSLLPTTNIGESS